MNITIHCYVKRSVKWLAIATCGFYLQACQSLPQHFGVVTQTPQTPPETVLSRLSSQQQLASYFRHDEQLGLGSALDDPHKPDWRHWQAPELPQYDLWDRLRSNFKLDDYHDDPRITAQLNWYKRHPSYMDRVIKRANRYMFYVLDEVEKRQLPGELALLPIIESAYDPFAYSHGRASGMWQFIPGTARYFGLKNNWWYDGRRDVVASTDAALTYLERLNGRFDDWLLALASYNAGGGNVNRARRHNLARGGDGRFWNLNLPRETEAYVPKLLAVARIFADPEAYGIQVESLPNRPYFEAVNTGGQIDLALAADLAGITVEELYLLNPGYSQWATSPSGPHRLLVPRAHAQQLRAALRDMPAKKRMAWQRYKVKRGDSLLTISRQYRTTPTLIRQANQLRSNMIRAGNELLIPIPSQDRNHYSLSANQRLQKNQNIHRNGQRLEYQIQPGDSFWLLARRHHVSVRDLARWNNMAPGDPLVAGKKLVIWSQAKNARLLAQNSSREVIRRVNYSVRRGDSLAAIASRFKVSVREIARWNSLNPNHYLQPGQSITLYVDVTRH